MQNINTKNFKHLDNGLFLPGINTLAGHIEFTVVQPLREGNSTSCLQKEDMVGSHDQDDKCACTYLHVRSSNNWHLRSKYSVHWDKSLKQVQIEEGFNLKSETFF